MDRSHIYCPPLDPRSGVYVAIMGAIAATMVFHEHPTKWEKGVWILCTTGLMFAEIRNLYVADKENADIFKGITDSLRETKEDLKNTEDGLDATKKELEKTADKIGQTSAGIKTVYSEQTGGDSVFYFEISRKVHAKVNFALLGKSDCPDVLKHFWSGHAPKHVSERYERLHGEREYRLEWAERIGLGFKTPSSIGQTGLLRVVASAA